MKKLKKIMLLFSTIALLGSCEKNDEINRPLDGSENFITELKLTLGDDVYSADICNNKITLYVPYNVELDGAIAELTYTTSATILPNPKDITDWSSDQIFRVTSYDGEVNEYEYTVTNEEITSESDVVLNSMEDLAAFAKAETSVVEGDLVIGSSNGDEIISLNDLSNLKEVKGNLVIKNSVKASTLDGLNNITKLGGLIIGSTSGVGSLSSVEFVVMESLEEVSRDIIIRCNQTKGVEFKSLTKVGSINIASSTLNNIDFSNLLEVYGDLIIHGHTQGEYVASTWSPDINGGTITSIYLPKLMKVQGIVNFEFFSSLESVELLALVECGGINLTVIPLSFSKINIPNIKYIYGDFFISSSNKSQIGGSLTNELLTKIDGCDELEVVEGTLTLSYLNGLTDIPNLSNATIGGCNFSFLNDCNGIYDFSNTIFLDNSELIIYSSPLTEIIGQTHMNCSVKIYNSTTYPKLTNIEEINGLILERPKTMSIDELTNQGDEYTFSSNLKKVYGDLCFVIAVEGLESDKIYNISFPNLESVDGNFQVKTNNNAFSAPKLKEVGGELKFRDDYNISYPMFRVDLSSLERVAYQDDINYVNPNYLSFDITIGASTSSYDPGYQPENVYVTMPRLNKIGGTGVNLNYCIPSNLENKVTYSMPELTMVSGSIKFSSERWETTHKTQIEYPFSDKLTEVGKVEIIYFDELNDYSLLKPFFEKGLITNSDNWVVSSCEYNPTYAQMVDGQYTPPTE